MHLEAWGVMEALLAWSRGNWHNEQQELFGIGKAEPIARWNYRTVIERTILDRELTAGIYRCSYQL